MKKRISSLLAVMALALFLCVPALAAGFDEAELYFVTDEAGLLSEQEWSDLEARAEEISLKYKCGVYIIAVDNFKNDDWYGGFQDYLEKSGSMLQSAREGHPLDVDSNPLIRLAGIGISLLVGCVAAFVIAVGVSDRMMKSVSAKTKANAYLIAGSVEITGREDHFTHTTETRTKIEKSSGSGGTTVDSDGFSSKSGKF